MKNIKETTYPRNLLIELGLKELEVTTDQLAGLDKILHSLSERDTNIMHMRYIEKLTIREIANRYSLSEGSIISIITHSITVLKNKNMIAYIINGLEGNLKAIAKENILNNDSNEHCRIEIYNKSYFELQLPVRSRNAFRRHDIKTIGDVVRLVNSSPHWYRYLRNVGENTAKEVVLELWRVKAIDEKDPCFMIIKDEL